VGLNVGRSQSYLALFLGKGIASFYYGCLSGFDITSRSNEEHHKLALNLGAAAYFSKPYAEEQLLQTLAQLMQPTRRSPGSPALELTGNGWA
jgi:hypothetical protein